MEAKTLNNSPQELAQLIGQHREALLSQWRKQVRGLHSARDLDIPTLNDHIPKLLDELRVALREQSEVTIAESVSGSSPRAHGLSRLQNAFDIEEVVAEYNIFRGCIHDLAEENGIDLHGRPFRIINRVLDQAIGVALRTYSTQRALEVQQRREEYLAFVAHDLRTPLNAISLAGRVLETMLPDSSTNAEIAQMLKALRRNLQHLEALVSQVLAESNHLDAETGLKLERREFDLWPLVQSVIHDLRPASGLALTNLFNRVPDDLVVYADAGMLRRVFQNLLSNALRYAPQGDIFVEAFEVPDAQEIECRVRDSGSGIPAELLGQVFEKGEADPEHVGGTGLGLAIVKTFVEAHGGTVAVDSKEGRGATFSFRLPTRVKAVP